MLTFYFLSYSGPNAGLILEQKPRLKAKVKSVQQHNTRYFQKSYFLCKASFLPPNVTTPILKLGFLKMEVEGEQRFCETGYLDIAINHSH